MRVGISSTTVAVSDYSTFCLCAINRMMLAMKPEQIPLGYYTHINYAFAYIDPNSFQMVPMAPDVASLYKDVTALKRHQLDLRVWISIGDWSFNNADEPTATTFSDLARSSSA